MDGQPLSEHDQSAIDTFARFLAAAGAPIPALSLTRPWTELVVSGVKDVENRSWATSHRGPLIVHGAKSWDDGAQRLLDELGGDGMLTPEQHAAVNGCAMHRDAPTGYLGVVELVSVHKAGDLLCQECSPWAFDGSWHWQLAHALRFPAAIAGGGQLGMWAAPATAAQAARRALAQAVDSWS